MNYFIWYSVAVYFVARLAGITLYNTIRKLRLDHKFKVFRFKNQWAYIFTGEILNFPKFRNEKESKANLKYLFPYVDVLVQKNERETLLFSGYIKDYELDCTNIQVLDKIYLTRAKRYSEGNKKPKPVPRDILIIPGRELKNINVQYVYSDKHKKKSLKRRKVFFTFLNIFLLIGISCSLPLFFIPFRAIEWPFYIEFFDLNWSKRLYLWFVTGSLYSLIFPFKTRVKGNSLGYQWIGWKNYLGRVFIVTIYISIVYFWIF